MDFDEQWYITKYPDVAAAVAIGEFKSGYEHYEKHGMKEGRASSGPRPWPYSALPPQRYFENYYHYQNRGGLICPHDEVVGFIDGESENHHDMTRFFSFCLIFDQICKENLIGDFAELGVWKGHTAALLANMARKRKQQLYLFDTFAGYDPIDLDGVDKQRIIQFQDTSLAGVQTLLGMERVTYVTGYFPDSCAQVSDNLSFCCVHLDCDLYKPIKSGLEYFYPRIIPGGFLIIHDYSSLHWDGTEKAIDEFFADKPESVVPLPDAAGSVVIRRQK